MFALLHKLGRAAEIRRGLRLVSKNLSAAEIAANNGTVTGSPTYSADGIVLDGTSYVTYNLQGWETDSAETTFSFEFWPGFATNDAAAHILISTTGDSTRIEKLATGELQIRAGGTTVQTISEATYSPYWLVGQRNVLSVKLKTGNSSAELNGTSILSADPTAFTPAASAALYIGARSAGTNLFSGTIGEVKFYRDALLTAQEAADTYNQTTYSYEDSAVAIWPMRTAEHDAANTRTLDVSGNGNHAVYSGGVTKRTERGYELDGVDGRLVLPAINTGTEFTLVLLARVFADAVTEVWGHSTAQPANYEIFTNSNGDIRLRGGALTPVRVAVGGFNAPQLGAFTCAYNDAVASIYRNGQLLSTGAVTAPDAESTIDAIGAIPDGTFATKMDVLYAAIFSCELTPTQIHDLNIKLRGSIHAI